jgi:hypothetical protein
VPESMTPLPTSHLGLICPFHREEELREGDRDRLWAPPRLVKAAPAPGRRLHAGLAKNSPSSRKEEKPVPVGSSPVRITPHSGNPSFYLGFLCGQIAPGSSTPMILAFLTCLGAPFNTRPTRISGALVTSPSPTRHDAHPGN